MGLVHVTLLSSAVAEVLSLDVNEHVARSTLAFVLPGGLTYPENEIQTRQLAANSTVVLNNLEQTSSVFRMLSSELISAAHRRISFSAYISTPRSHVLGMHLDMWDNIVLQLRGSKRFIFESSPPVLLQPGMTVTIPQEVRHAVETVEDSLHLSTVMLRK